MKFLAIMQLLRMHQYAKNLLLFLPLLLAHQFAVLSSWSLTALGFVSFSLLASSNYIINDRLDIKSDQVHRTKNQRPLAAGKINYTQAYGLAIICFTLAMITSLYITPRFQLILIIYLVLSLIYSIQLKKIIILDILMLVLLYLLRLGAGAVTAKVPLSDWFVLFSSCFFLSLAILKRYTELYFMRLSSQNNTKTKFTRRGYDIKHSNILRYFGYLSAGAAVLILVCYVRAQQGLLFYQQPKLLYLCCPVLLIWLIRVWRLATKGLVHEDPVLFALKDQFSYWVIMSFILFGFVAKIGYT